MATGAPAGSGRGDTWWVAVAGDTDEHACYMNLDTAIDIARSSNRYYGLSVRQVSTIYTIWHIQDANSYVGCYVGGSLAFSADYSEWWSRTSRSSTHAYFLDEYSNGHIDPSSQYGRGSGYSVRCP